ncbi:MAG: flagellar basal-body rod protein FlgG [Methylococcales bacterium]|jgi:flagellar basal-body rod protein FlgG|nr:flagellar basal-body rod protein FlgG [Methylococcales bacterium]MBT7408731.1 flagellar basal-body rod protein FlgG [Methylococcales bacterium]
MYASLWIAKTGLDAQQTRMSTISNNMANVNTVGFKKERALFSDLLYQNVRQVGSQTSQDTKSPTGLQVGTGVRTVATEKIHTQGNLLQTGNSLDVSIQGRGYFQIRTPDGNLGYTRDGSFKMNSEGLLVDKNGYTLDPQITLPANANTISISEDGIVGVVSQGETAPTNVGQIQLADFINPSGLQAVGDNIYVETASSGSPSVSNPGTNGAGGLIQGALESSNVNIVEEMVNMIETQRAYEMNSKAISTTDSMIQNANQNL